MQGLWHTMRILACFLKSDYAAAAAVLEQMIARHPEKLRLYPLLADLYLVLGRRDERALKIFETVIRFNLESRYLEKIHSAVAEKYLREYRMDSDAITVLEHELAAECRRRQVELC